MDKINKNKLTCVLTGIVVRVAPQTFDERAARYGGVESLLANYVCAEGRKLLREGKTPEEIRGQYNISTEVPLPSIETLNRHTRWSTYLKEKDQTPIVDMPTPPQSIQGQQIL